ncbi:MAG TPA: MFS transporter [Sphingomonas sp.]|nr:MFS transporter [Sphingomonas sp.]
MRPSPVAAFLKPRRRGLASVNAEIRDGIVPAASAIAPVRDQGPVVTTAPSYRVVALIIATALFMENLDATVLATALPTMARDFGVPAPAMSLALTSYLLALALFIPASGNIADRFGSRGVFRAAIALFVAGSLACGQATDLPLMVAARFVQGIGGAMMIPVGRLVLLRSVARQDMVNAMSWLIMPALIGPILGPPLGGFIVTYLNWHWIFWLNLPIGIVGFWLVGRFIADVRGDHPAPFDIAGFALSGVSLGCLLFGFEMTSRAGEGILAAVLIAIGIVSGGFYLRHAKGREDAILDLSLMRVKSFRLSVIAGSLTRITQGAQPFLLPLMMQLGFGFSAARSGTITVATAVGSLVMKSIAPRILKRFGFRDALVTMGLLGTAGYAVCGFFRPSWPMWSIYAVLIGCGFLMSFTFTAYNTIAYDEIDKDRMSRATSFYSTFQQLMLSLGICIAASGLHIAMTVRGHGHPALGDFTVAFLIVTAISALATIWNASFDPDAGAELSGRAPAAPSRAAPSP